jgi:hypothetical protein
MGKGFGAATSSNRSSQAADRFFDRAVEALGRSDQTGAMLALRAALARARRPDFDNQQLREG